MGMWAEDQDFAQYRARLTGEQPVPQQDDGMTFDDVDLDAIPVADI